MFGSVRKQKDAERLTAEFGNTRFTSLVFDITDESAVTAAAAEARPPSSQAEASSCARAKGDRTPALQMAQWGLQVQAELAGCTLFGLVNNAGIVSHGPTLLQPIAEMMWALPLYLQVFMLL